MTTAHNINLWAQGFIPIRYPTVNKTLYWTGSDSEQNFLKNPKPEYNETSITYVYNTYGYRTKEFELTTPNSNILCLGCSHTEGVGLRYEDVWVSQILNQFLDYNVYNLGFGGGSGDTVTRTLVNCCSVFQPKKVFILWPSMSRFETYSFDSNSPGYPQLNFNCSNDITRSNIHLYDKIQLKANLDKNRALVIALKQIYGFELYEIYADDLTSDDKFRKLSSIDRARDFHYGPTQHKRIAEMFLQQMNAN
jgi:hypothetical protein